MAYKNLGRGDQGLRAATSSRCCAIRRSAPTSIRWWRPNSPTGATSSAPGARPACCSTSRTTWSNLFVEGPDALKLLSHLATNSFKNFTVDQAKQFAPCSYDGYVIGDGILFYLAENSFVYRRPRADGQLDRVPRQDRRLQREDRNDDRSPSRPMGKPVIRKFYRYQIQGPNAKHVIEKLNGGTDAGHQVLQHGRHHTSPAARCARCATAWPARRASKCGARTPKARKSAPRSSKPARTSASCRSAPAPTRPTRWSPAGFPRRCRRSTPATR